MSYHRLSVKPLNVTLNTLLKRAAHVGLGVGAFTPILALANPTGGQVVAGQATIATPNANGLVINQASQSCHHQLAAVQHRQGPVRPVPATLQLLGGAEPGGGRQRQQHPG